MVSSEHKQLSKVFASLSFLTWKQCFFQLKLYDIHLVSLNVVLCSCTILTALVGKFPASISSLWVALLFLQHHGMGFLFVFVLVRRRNHFFASTALHIIREVKKSKKLHFVLFFQPRLVRTWIQTGAARQMFCLRNNPNNYSQPLWVSYSFWLGDVAFCFVLFWTVLQ